MEDMIAQEPGLAVMAREPVADADALAVAIVDAARAGRSVVVVGSGTAEHAAFGVAEILDEALRGLGLPPGIVAARESFEASLEPRSGGVCIAVSHTSRSAKTVRALETARLNGARSAVITADPDAPAAAAADLVVKTPFVDRSFCHTIGYLSPLVAAGVVGASIQGEPLDGSRLARLLERAMAVGDQARAVGGRLHGVAAHLVAGSGADMHAARELALKIEEGVRVPAAMRGLETLMHGHLVAMDEQTSLIVLCTERRSRSLRAERALVALRAARRLGIRTAAIVTDDVADSFTPREASEGIAVVADDARLPAALSSLSISAAALQHLTVGLVHAAGINPDLIRREELPYREVSVMTETKIR